MVMQIPKEVFYEDEFFKLSYEEYGACLYMHCIVQKWKPSVLKNMYRVFSRFKDFAISKGMVNVATVSPNPKFAKLFGGTVIEEFVLEDIKYEVVIWDLRY